MSSRWFAALAPAKVNLWLRVLGRRDDGFHELDTALVALDWCDEVRARVVSAADAGSAPETGSASDTESPAVRLSLAGPALTADVPADERNLAWRAAAAVLREALVAGAVAKGTGLELELTKHVPSRAGLGGGSADAVAAALVARAALGLAPMKPRELSSLAAALGSDTVFFADAAATGYARCTGRGERVEARPLGAGVGLFAAVITPAAEASTAAVFEALARFRAEPSRPSSPLPEAAAAPRVLNSFLDQPLDWIRAGLVNDLEPSALAAVPELAAWRHVLNQCGADHFRLSGSGSSFFGLFEAAETASRCIAEIETLGLTSGLTLRASRVAAPAGHGARLAASRS